MSGWVPMPVDGWQETAELLTSTGKPWPEQAAVTDLRWHVDQGRPLPGRPTLCKRWNWTDKPVRNLLAATDRWWDPLRGPAPTSRVELSSHHHPGRGPAQVQVGSSLGPAQVQVDNGRTSTIETESPAQVQVGSSLGPAQVHTRGDPPSPSPSPPPEKKTDVADGSRQPPPAESAPTKEQRRADFDQLLEVWNTEIVPTARKRGAQVAPHERLQPSSGLGKLVRQRLDQHGLDRCLSVVRWFGSADHPRAQFLRDGGHELSTLMRPQKFDEYAAFAEAPVALVGRHKHDPAPARAPPPVMSREEYERELALQAEIDRKREAERRPLWTK